MDRLPEDLQRALGMAYNLYHRGLSKDAGRLREVAGRLAPYGVALSDFKKFRIGFSPAPRGAIAGYYAEQFARYPALRERFRALGLLSNGTDTLAGCVTFPVLAEDARPEGLVGLEMESGEQVLPPGQDAAPWLFPLEKAAYGVRDHSLAIVTCGVLSFFTLYSILGAIGLDVAVGLAAARLEAAALARLEALGASEVFVLAPVAGGLPREGLRLHVLPRLEGASEALERLAAVAALTTNAQVRWMLERAVEAKREQLLKARAPGDER